jgi:DNA-binding transcriptional ArsR family regulator
VAAEPEAFGRELDALGDRTRRAIFERLARGPLPVAEIARGLPVSRPAVSQHLKVLESARLVVARAQGTRRLYQHDARGIGALKDYFESFWSEALDAFRIEAERSWQDPTRQESPARDIRSEPGAEPRRRPARHPRSSSTQSARRKRKPS